MKLLNIKNQTILEADVPTMKELIKINLRGADIDLSNNLINTYTINTKVFKPGVIEQKFMDENTILAEWIIETRDTDIIESLKELGWTPPGGKNVKCICEDGCSAKQTGHCALSHCPKFTQRH